MRVLRSALNIGLVTLLILVASCKKQEIAEPTNKVAIDSTQITTFFQKHPDFKDFQKDVMALYRRHGFNYVWYEEDGRREFADVLYNRASQLGVEGVLAELPYQKEFDEIFDDDSKKPKPNKDLLISSMYFFYAKKVYEGIDPAKSKQLGWYLPRERVSYVKYLDELMKDPDKISKDEEEMVPMYYNLRKGLMKYRQVRDNGGWGVIDFPEGKKALKPGDNDHAIGQVRKRLFLGGYLPSDNGSTVYDKELRDGVLAYRKRQNLKEDPKITQELIKELNIPVEARIKTILVNMERCRWLPADIFKSREYISVNVPSYNLRYIRDGKPALESNVVVGNVLNKTVIFSGKMSYLVFSPYWNIPKSIMEKEILPGIEEDRDYLEKHNMEWDGERIRQLPGPDNSLGQVKFMFPNQNNIYLHDTPAKNLFKKEDRALSHGCIRVEKARDLAVMILDDDKEWDAAKVDEAMNAGEEKQYGLKKKIPVYISYFTALADEDGNVAFF
ncbi:MAG TPA: L,D-transpeptidase family protein, partial [Flavobacterium sp.]